MKCPMLAAGVLVLLVAPFARADEFEDFRIPTHRVASWLGSLRADGAGGYTGWTNVEGEHRALNGEGRSEGSISSFGDTSLTSVRWAVGIAGGGTRQERRYDRGTTLDQHTRRDATESWSASFGHLRRFGGTPLHVGLDLSGGVSYAQSWETHREDIRFLGSTYSYRRLDESDDRTRNTSSDVGLALRFGCGWVRDVTGVHTARVIEERLRQEGVLERPLSHDARQRLASLVAIADDLGVRSRPGEAVWGQIATILREDGALSPSGLTAASAERAGEPLFDAFSRSRRADGLPEPSVSRLLGHRIELTLESHDYRQSDFGVEHQLHRAYESDSLVFLWEDRYSRPSASTTDIVLLGIAADWHRPLGWRWQLDGNGSVSAPVRPQNDGFNVYVSPRASWTVTNRWSATAGFTFQRDRLENSSTRTLRHDHWSSRLQADLGYAIEDHVQITLSGFEQQTRRQLGPASIPFGGSYTRFHGFSFGLTYRFAGRFFAPGFPALSQASRVQPVL